ncbi:MAG: zinc metallopeptidase [Eubacterium sp.]|nr:zinc metallopeptidase [Eubacterium sp.]
MGAYFAYYLTGIFVIPVLIFSLVAQGMVKRRFRKYSSVLSRTNMTGAQAAYRLLQLNGITDVSIQQTGGNLTDNYNPKNKVISLSEGVYNSTSVAAIGIACHEAGHACQHANAYAPLAFRNFVIPVTRVGSWLGVPLVIIGTIISSRFAVSTNIGYYIALFGLVLYSFVALFQFITLPVEFNASRRALETIRDNGFLVEDEYDGAKKVLTAAALTYVAALASSVVTLLRLFIVLSGSRRR